MSTATTEPRTATSPNVAWTLRDDDLDFGPTSSDSLYEED